MINLPISGNQRGPLDFDLVSLAEFTGDFTAFQAAEHFASLATPEPRRAKQPEGKWDKKGGWWMFQLVGGRRDYILTCCRKTKTWRVFMVPKTMKVERVSREAEA